MKDGATEEDLLRALEILREAASGRGASGSGGGPNPRVDPLASSTLAQLAGVARRVAACSLTGDGSGCRTGFCVLVAQLFGSGHRRAAPSASSAACDSSELLSLMQVLHCPTHDTTQVQRHRTVPIHLSGHTSPGTDPAGFEARLFSELVGWAHVRKVLAVHTGRCGRCSHAHGAGLSWRGGAVCEETGPA